MFELGQWGQLIPRQELNERFRWIIQWINGVHSTLIPSTSKATIWPILFIIGLILATDNLPCGLKLCG